MYFPRSRRFWSVSFGHMANDIFMSMGPVFLAFASAKYLKIGVAEVGLAISIRELIGALSQPFFGWLGDRTGGRLQAAGGVAWTAGMMLASVMLSVTGNFWLMIIPYALSALGSGAFHPVGAMYASEAKREYAASSTAYFFLLGQLGLAIGPAVAGLLLNQAKSAEVVTLGNLVPVFSLLIVALPSISFMAVALPAAKLRIPATPPAAQVAAQATEAASKVVAQAAARIPTWPLLMLLTLIILRSVAHIGTVNYLPVLFRTKGWDPAAYGAITSVYWLASAFSGVISGQLADRFGRRRVISMSLLVGSPLLFLLPLAEGSGAVVLALGSGALLGASFPIMLVIIQGLFPASKGFVSGLTLGMVFAAGAIGSFFMGLLADPAQIGIGLEATFQVVAGLGLVACLIAFLLPQQIINPQAQPA